MTPERWREIRDVLQSALELGPDPRAAYLARTCSTDQSLRVEVESLLAADSEARSTFLQAPPLARLTIPKGAKLGEYEIVSLLGSGGMGEVYRALDPRLGRDVAIKVLPSFLSSDPERLRRFEQEARAAAALNHPNILAVHHMGTYEGAPYLVSELLEGGTLREQMNDGSVPLRKAVDYGVQIAHGLAAAHDKGIIHRDLKPENLFVSRDGRVKILDFGLAKLLHPKPVQTATLTKVDDETEPGVVMGTAGYMSPEQVRGHPADHRGDIFAFGAILYEMLAGRRAFKGQTSADTMTAILKEEPPGISQIVPTVPPGLQRVVHRCLEKNPEQRFQSTSDLGFALESFSDSAVAPGAGRSAGPTARLNWRMSVAAVAGVVLLAAWLVWRSSPLAIPRVEGVRQLTDDGEPKTEGGLATDGLRVYFNEGQSSSQSRRIAQVSSTGGQTSSLPTRFKSPSLEDLASDASALLVKRDDTGELWLQPLPAGEPRSLGVRADSASLFADGRIVFTTGTGLNLAEKDGSNPRKLTTVPGWALAPAVSPNGERIRFLLVDDSLRFSTWEINSDGTDLHQIMKTWPDSMGQSGGAWTRDGKYFIFSSDKAGRLDLWAIPEDGGFFHRSSAPVQLTNGPLSYEAPFASPDGKQIFAVGSKKRGELVHYDPKSREFVPYLLGISAVESRVSRDGKWIIYVSYPDHTLWRSRSDGSDRAHLTFAPMMVFYPEISPDGTKVAFSGLTPSSGLGLYVLSMEGGIPEKLAEFGHGPAWSPDGNSLAFTALVPGKHLFDGDLWCEIHTIDLNSKRVSVVPGLQSKFAPWWPQSNAIVAFAVENNEPYRFDFKTERWSQVASGIALQNWTPSSDGNYLYVLGNGPAGERVIRIRAADYKVETVVNLQRMRLVNDEALGQASSSAWIGIAADGSVTLTRDAGSDEIYALDMKWP